jgi:hypothetical protein
MHDTAKSYQCRHIRTTGRRCGSPSLRGEHFCYFHQTTRRPPDQAEARAIAAGYPIEPKLHFESFEDRPSVQLCLLEVMNRIASGAIEKKLAGILLYGLQIAANNLPREPSPARATSSKHSAHNREQAPTHEPNCAPERLVEELTLDPDHGPLAPITEMPDPANDPDRYISPLQGIFDRLSETKEAYYREQARQEAAKIPCTHCGHANDHDQITIPTIQAVAA